MPVLALLLLFEEWGWDPLAALVRRMSRWPLWAWCERKIAGLSPWLALLVFLLPALALLPIKLIALWLIRHGQYALGVGILVLAKLIGTALVARIFQLTQPALMQFAWFAYFYPRWKAWKDQLIARVRASSLWRTSRQIKQSAQSTLRTWRDKFKA